ncbi:hypothetical protein SMICM17S_09611 [Streptomyces microflavus]
MPTSRIAVTGSSGLIGAALVRSLRADGHEVARLVRRPARSGDEVEWDPKRGHVDVAGLVGCDAVVHVGRGGGRRCGTTRGAGSAYRRGIWGAGSLAACCRRPVGRGHVTAADIDHRRRRNMVIWGAVRCSWRPAPALRPSCCRGCGCRPSAR